MPSLPIIPIAPFLPSHISENSINTQQNTAKALHAACRDYGFFYLDLTGFVDTAETDELTQLARAFFAQPQSAKDAVSLRKSDNARGYARLNENVTNGKADAHEGIDFYRPVQHPDPSKPLQGENQWPDILNFREQYERWTDKMQELGIIVMHAMALGLGMTPEEWDALRDQVDESFWVMRIIGYPPIPEDHDGFSCGAHKDYGCLTFLYADPTRGALQVYLQNPVTIAEVEQSVVDRDADGGGVWINADPIPGCFVCNIGEMWEIWTRGLYKSTLHRVIHKGSNYRISIPFFFEPNFTALIQPLDAIARLTSNEDRETLDKEKAVARKNVVYGEFLMGKVAGNFSEEESSKGRYDSGN